MRKFHLFAALCAATSLLALHAQAQPTSLSLDFNGSGNTLAATGFDAAYNLNTTGFSVAGGVLTTHTLDGDTYGNYENDPDTAQNQFYSVLTPQSQTLLQGNVTVSGLNANFHGGGIWMGTDEDHYARLGVFHNSFLTGGPIGIELLRENQDRWGGATPPGQGDDIVSSAVGIGGQDPQTTPVSVQLRLIRNGNTVIGLYSLDNGVSFLPAGTFSGFAMPGDPQGLGSNTEEAPVSFKVGIYALGGGSPQATYAFDSLTASAVPEPASVAVIALAGLLVRRRR